MLDWLERRIGWIAFPQIIRYLAYFQLGVVVLSFFSPEASALLSFDWNAILKGEVWRVFSFIFIPISGGASSMGVIFAVFAALILMLFSDGLEGAWGTFRTTLFFLVGWFICSLASVIASVFISPLVPMVIPPSLLFDYAIFFAFATYFPMYELRLFFILPVKIFILAIIAGVSLLLMTSFNPILLAYCFLCLAHYLVIAVPMLMNRGKAKSHKMQFERKVKKPEVFHECEICGVTDNDDESLAFRVQEDGTEICENCRH